MKLGLMMIASVKQPSCFAMDKGGKGDAKGARRPDAAAQVAGLATLPIRFTPAAPIGGG